eukprot:2789404-Pyramimonas_sp.AAC.1
MIPDRRFRDHIPIGMHVEMSVTNHGCPTGDNDEIDRGCLMRCLQKGYRIEELFTKIDEQIKEVPLDIWEQLHSNKSPDF